MKQTLRSTETPHLSNLIACLLIALVNCSNNTNPRASDDIENHATDDVYLRDVSDGTEIGTWDTKDTPVDRRADVGPGDTSVELDTAISDTTRHEADIDGYSHGDTGYRSKSPWEQPNPCYGRKTYPSVKKGFKKPNRADPPQKGVTLSGFRKKFGKEHPLIIGFFPDKSLEPGLGLAETLFADRGEKVHFRLFIAQPRGSAVDENALPSTAYVGMLVNYRPTQFKFTRSDSERKKILKRRVTTGVELDIQREYTPFDLTIPSAAFSKKGYYELAIYIAIKNSDRFGVSTFSSRRIALYYGGYERSPHRCFQPALDDPELPLEKDLGKKPIRLGNVWAHLNGMLIPGQVNRVNDWRMYPKAYPAKPREKKSLRVSLSSVTAALRKEPWPTVVVPFVDGRPLDERWFITLTAGTRQTYHKYWNNIDARKMLTVEMPKKPGMHEVFYVGWHDAFRPRFDYEGNPNPGVIQQSGFTSNIVRYEVKGKSK